MIKLLQLFRQEAHQVSTYSNDEPLDETSVVFFLFYFILTCSTNNAVIEIQNFKNKFKKYKEKTINTVY